MLFGRALTASAASEVLSLRPILLTSFALLCLAHASADQTLYDGRKGTAPDRQKWTFFATGGSQSFSKASRAPTFSTLGHSAFQGGYSRLLPFNLSRAKGYAVNFDLQVLAETHGTPNRAGVDLIVLGADKKGLELGFWTDQIWAQGDKPLFHHAEGAALNTAAKLVHYQLQVQGRSYRLFADSRPVLSGPIRDYTAFEGFINPYRTPNFLFLGDDSTSASGSFRLTRFSVSRRK
jgi:hypothetical protein